MIKRNHHKVGAKDLIPICYTLVSFDYKMNLLIKLALTHITT